MPSRLAKTAVMSLLLGLNGLASAGTTAVDLFTATGVPGTGGTAVLSGPCYCDQPALFSPVVLLQPGTYDFGTVRDYWVQSRPTPDGGPDQPNLYLLVAPLVLSGSYPGDFPQPPSFFEPSSTALCDQADDACNAKYQSAYADFDLVFTMPSGQDAAEVALIGNYRYTAPVPEPSSSGMFIAGAMLVAAARVTTRRRRRPPAS